jgi:hypothetical protein
VANELSTTFVVRRCFQCSAEDDQGQIELMDVEVNTWDQVKPFVALK